MSARMGHSALLSLLNSEFIICKYVSTDVIEVLIAVTMRSTMFPDVTSCSPVEVHRRFGGSHCCCCFLCLVLLGLLPDAEMEAVRSSETPVNFYQTTRRHVINDSTVQSNNFRQIEIIFVSFIP
jgi:hypothetical protein